jgi:ribosome-associated translation inhibitor RaiA
MPDGVVQWFDPATDKASIVRNNRAYAARGGDIESHARHAGARVHFDIRRVGGVGHAVNVTLRVGTRTSHRQHRFGGLAGAHDPNTKQVAPFTRAYPKRGRNLEAHPLGVVRAWALSLAARDVDAALLLYAPDATLHAGDEALAGRDHLKPFLEASPLFGREEPPDIRGDDGTVVLRWADEAMHATREVRSQVAHGLIGEQWFGAAAPSRRAEVETGAGRIDVVVLAHERVADSDVEYALDRVGSVLAHVDDPILFARLKLDRAADPARARPSMIQVAVDIDGELVRAQVAAHDMQEAADLLKGRLSDQLDHRAERREHLRAKRGEPEPGEWRHGDLATIRPDYYERPPDERRLVRHKAFALEELTADEAAFDMEQLDYDFHLFRDLASGEDALMERVADGTYRLTRLHPTAVEAGPVAVSITVAGATPPELGTAEAVERLAAGGGRFLFFADADTGRGSVVYRRYDGHYGLITADGPAP